MQNLRFGNLLFTELAMLLAVGFIVTVTLILPKGIIHFNELIVTTYTNGTMDFSTDATVLVRSLGILSLLTLTLGLALGAAMGLTASSFARVEKTNEYESSLTTAGFMKITATRDGTTYELTEHGRRFLREYAFLNRETIMASSVIDGNSSTSETIAE